MRRVGAGFVIGAMLVSPGVMAQFGAEPAELDLVRVTDDIYVIHNEYVPGNITVLVTDEGVLLVDTKYSIDYTNVEAMLAEITDQPIRYVVNTHFHDDHSGANQIFQAAGASVFAAENARIQMLDSGRVEGLPNMTIADSGTIHIGNTSVELYYFGRSHTNSDIVALFPDQRVLAAGDMYANDPGTPEYIDYAGGGSAEDWPRTLTRALGLDFDTVVPGHGTVAPRADMEAFRDETARLAEMVKSMIRGGRSRNDVEAMLRSEFNFQDFHIASLAGLLVELQ
jgi:glyoxylase-like metal-dependent hydrolase (beta-lactamase superfamily II)